MFSSTTQETSAESDSETPYAVTTVITAEVAPHVTSTPAEADSCIAATSTAEVDQNVAATSISSFNLSDLGTIQPPSALSDEKKYQILSTIPTKLKKYPVNSQKRHYQPYWTEQFPWVRYSASLDGVYCGPCFLFSQVRFNSEFVSSPFRNWKNAVGTSCGILNRHSQSETHKQCMERAVSFIAVMEKNKQSIKSQLSEAYDKQVQVNTRALLAIIDGIQFLVKQGLGLRGSNWDKGSKREDGNFTSLVDLLSKYNADLESHLHNSPRNARYLSPKVQNEFIRINGDLIRKSVVEECNASPFWSVMADEATDVSTTEQLSVHVCSLHSEERHSST